MASNIAVTELDFATIKQNIKTFLRGQSEFTDFDFDGSAISVLIDALAYAAHITAVQANMSFNEIFLDSATLRNSVISRAKELNYLPRSETAAQATVNMVVAMLMIHRQSMCLKVLNFHQLLTTRLIFSPL